MKAEPQALGSRYQLLEPIGRGAMGQVWRARSIEGDPYAVKVLRPELSADPDVVGRFVQERWILQAIDSEHVVRVHDLVVEGDTLGIVMDLVVGEDLRGVLRREPTLPPGEACELVRQALVGLGAVHRAGIIHRDLKPENVLIDDDRGSRRVRITDFGVSRLTHGPSLTRMTSLIGTPRYMAPETIESGPTTGQADVYAAGVMLYEMVAGRPPFDGHHPLAVLRDHQETPPPPVPGLDDQLWVALEWLLAKAPEARPAALEAADALADMAPRLATLPALSPPPPPPTMAPADATGRPGPGADGSGPTRIVSGGTPRPAASGADPSPPIDLEVTPEAIAPPLGAALGTADTGQTRVVSPSPAARTPLPAPHGAPPAAPASGEPTGGDPEAPASTAAAAAVTLAPPAGGARDHRRVLVAGAAAAIVLLVAALVAVLAGGGEDPGTIQLTASETADDHRAERTYESEGSALRVRVVLTNTTGAALPAGAFHDEVIPKDVATDVADLVFDPEPDEIIETDPIVRYHLDGLAPGEAITVTYRATLDEEADRATLQALADDQQATSAAYHATLQSATLASLTLTPPTATLAVPATAGTVALSGTMTDGSPAPADALAAAAWTSSDPAVAAVAAGSGPSASITPVANGTATITATVGAVSTTATVTVALPTLASLQLTPTEVAFTVGTPVAMTLTGAMSDGAAATPELLATAVWSTADGTVATVSGSGPAVTVTPVANGATTVTATVGPLSAGAAVTVAVPPPAEAVIEPPPEETTTTRGTTRTTRPAAVATTAPPVATTAAPVTTTTPPPQPTTTAAPVTTTTQPTTTTTAAPTAIVPNFVGARVSSLDRPYWLARGIDLRFSERCDSRYEPGVPWAQSIPAGTRVPWMTQVFVSIATDPVWCPR